jgi:hypothetical protein
MNRDQYINIKKQYLASLIRAHQQLEGGSPEEVVQYTRMDNLVTQLLGLGVSEQEIREIINITHQTIRDNELNGIIVPPVGARRNYMTPANREEIRRMRDRYLYIPEEDDDAMPEGANAMPESLNGEDIELEPQTLQELQDMFKCPICLTNIKDIRYSPCGHMSCKSCARRFINENINKCPHCQKNITSYDKVYYSKYLKYKTKYLQLKNNKI